MEEFGWLLVCQRVGDDVDGGETRLFTRRHVDNGGFRVGVTHDGLIDRLHHGQQTRLVMRYVETLDTRIILNMLESVLVSHKPGSY